MASPFPQPPNPNIPSRDADTLHSCHCLDCQKWSGGPCTSNVVVPRKDFKITKGKPKNYNIKGDSGKMNDHWFCGGAFYLPYSSHPIPSPCPTSPITLSNRLFYTFPSSKQASKKPHRLTVWVGVRIIDCGSSLYTLLEVMPDNICIKAGSIDDKKARELNGKTGVEFYTKDRMGYETPVAGADQKEVFG